MKYALSFLLVLVLSVSCQQRVAVSCASIQNAIITNIDFDEITRETILSWINETQPLSGTLEIENPNIDLDTVADMAWKTQIGSYQAEFEGDYLVKIVLSFDNKNYPTGTEITDCMGIPQSYQAYSVDRQFQISLFYPEEGLIIRGSQETLGDGVPKNIHDIPIYDTVFVRPGKIEDIVKDAYPNNEGNVQFILKNAHPWSGDWNNIEYISP
jgi:hypothetical protein